MSFIRGGETITLRRRSKASTDDYGNPTYTTTTITIKDVLVALQVGSEPVDAERNAVDSQITLYIPNGTPIEDGDVFIIRNTSWVKNGMIQNWVSPFAGLDGGVVVPVRKRDG
jgi:hypothetical protein